LAGTLAFTGEPAIGPSQIFLARKDGTVVQLTHSRLGLGAIAWSPDSKRILAFEFHPKGSAVVVLNAN